MKTTEIEAKFFGIDVEKLKQKLIALGAKDKGESFFTEEIWLDGRKDWFKEKKKFVRVRQDGRTTRVTYKHFKTDAVDGTEEVEFVASDPAMVNLFFERIGLAHHRKNEKRVHTFELGEVVIGFDTWPGVKTYLEIEGPSAAAVKRVAKQLGFKWKDACFDSAIVVVERETGEPISGYKFYTFDYRGL